MRAADLGAFELTGFRARRLEVPLWEPFVIASGEIAATQAVLVEAEVRWHGRAAAGGSRTGLGEAPTLAPVTAEGQEDMLGRAAEAATWVGRRWPSLLAWEEELAATFADFPVTRAGLSAAVWDAAARAAGVPLHALLVAHAREGDDLAALDVPSSPSPLLTDITLSIAAPAHMAALARTYWDRGFRAFKVKIGRDADADVAALAALAAAVPGARFRLDANAGYRADQALAVLSSFAARGVVVECFEQPCARDDWAGHAEVTARGGVPVVADESLRGPEDLARIIGTGATNAVNLKLAKLGGPWPTLKLGLAARAAGLDLMAGAMVETRAGLATMAHVVAALEALEGAPAVAWVDLDTAFLMRDDPFDGGWTARGPELVLGPAPGTGLAWRGP